MSIAPLHLHMSTRTCIHSTGDIPSAAGGQGGPRDEPEHSPPPQHVSVVAVEDTSAGHAPDNRLNREESPDNQFNEAPGGQQLHLEPNVKGPGTEGEPLSPVEEAVSSQDKGPQSISSEQQQQVEANLARDGPAHGLHCFDCGHPSPNDAHPPQQQMEGSHQQQQPEDDGGPTPAPPVIEAPPTTTTAETTPTATPPSEEPGETVTAAGDSAVPRDSVSSEGGDGEGVGEGRGGEGG